MTGSRHLDGIHRPLTALSKKGIEFVVGTASYKNNTRGVIIGDDFGFLKLIFRRAEEARDSLLARHLAARLLLLVAERYPASVIAPKALLAAADARGALGDSVRQVLRRRYPESPYTRAAAGDFRPEYTTIEDSIRTLLTREILRAR